MRKSRIVYVSVVFALLLGGLSAGVLAGLGDDDNNNGNVVIEPNPPDRDDPCLCPQIWDPVVCEVNGERKLFGNACFAGCEGATNCRRFAVRL